MKNENEKRWDRYLSDRRIGLKDPDPDFRSNFQRDFDRIIFCSSFRRMQDKTQVFPLARNDYVRTRLTHSLEVASIGRSLGYRVGQTLKSKYSWSEERMYHLGEVVAAACLAHDIGNPPFGHSGEDTISHWFAIEENYAKYMQSLSENQREEFLKYEGNAQGFRVITRLQCIDLANRRQGGLQLTYATLGAFLKYPRLAYLPEADLSRVSQKKYNFFEAEQELFMDVVNELGLVEVIPGKAYARHPLCFLVEAADDISYTIADFMDGYRLGYASYETTRDFFLALLDDGKERYEAEIINLTDPKDRIEYLGGKAVGALVRQVAATFLENEEALLRGEYDQSLTRSIPSHKIVEEMTSFAHANIYSCSDVVKLKVAGFDVIHKLMETFVPAVCFEEPKDHYDWDRVRLILKLIPDQFLGEDGKPDSCHYTRLRKVVDFISGMTDSYAVHVYQQLSGVNLIL